MSLFGAGRLPRGVLEISEPPTGQPGWRFEAMTLEDSMLLGVCSARLPWASWWKHSTLSLVIPGGNHGVREWFWVWHVLDRCPTCCTVSQPLGIYILTRHGDGLKFQYLCSEFCAFSPCKRALCLTCQDIFVQI